MKQRSLRGRAWVGGKFHDDCVITIEGSLIADVQVGADIAAETISDGVILPGLIDVHVHGGGGADFMDGTSEAVNTVTTFHARHGTTALAATTLSASQRHIARAITAIAEKPAESTNGRAEIAGIHLEGPYINPVKSGAQDRASIRPPEIREVEEWIALAPQVRWMMTIAPEVEGAWAVLERFRHDILFSIGHTAATYAQALEAVQRGARHFTHLFNAMTPFHHRDPGVVGAALVSPQCTVELIADGVHVHPVVLQTFARLMPERVTLVTDAMRAAGLGPGSYQLYDYEVTVAEGAARLADGVLAGSTLTMIRALQNMVELAGLPLEQVLPWATEIPARILRLEKRKGRIEIGYDADLLVVSPRFELRRLLLCGEELSPA
jgi:N-acetylglucosamine-6-phosphate deacetylase